MTNPAEAAMTAWTWPSDATLVHADSGLINETWVVRAGDRDLAVLQRLNTAIFVPEVHEDIEAITAHLAAKGLDTPRLVRTRTDSLWHTDDDAGIWRVLSWVGQRTVHRLENATQARSAGALVCRFHQAVADLDWDFRSVRPGAHDTVAHMASLAAALDAHPAHRLRDAVGEVGSAVLEQWSRWEGPTDLPARIIHGDLKVSNIRFEGDTAVALIDLDTFQSGQLDAELGDALRSWCNPGAEDAARVAFDLRLFAAAMEGYASQADHGGPSEVEWASIVPGIERICLELAARFARDALEESYFGWDPRFATRGDHNLVRARNQLTLARTVRAAAAHAHHKLRAARGR